MLTGGVRIKKATSLHPKLKQHLQECVSSGAVPTWMTEGWTVLIMKDRSKGTVVGNYRPIACLPLIMWKLLTSIYSETIYGHLNCQELLQNEQKGCRTNSRGTKDQLVIDKAILKNCRRLTNLSMAWIDY